MSHGSAILLVEDNADDREMIATIIEQIDPGLDVISASSGEEALDVLSADQQDARCIALVLLALDQPEVDGQRVLLALKSEAIHAAPVIGLTSSDSAADVARAYASHCNACVKKPAGAAQYRDMLQKLLAFWFQAARLPPPA